MCELGTLEARAAEARDGAGNTPSCSDAMKSARTVDAQRERVADATASEYAPGSSTAVCSASRQPRDRAAVWLRASQLRTRRASAEALAAAASQDRAGCSPLHGVTSRARAHLRSRRSTPCRRCEPPLDRVSRSSFPCRLQRRGSASVPFVRGATVLEVSTARPRNDAGPQPAPDDGCLAATQRSEPAVRRPMCCAEASAGAVTGWRTLPARRSRFDPSRIGARHDACREL